MGQRVSRERVRRLERRYPGTVGNQTESQNYGPPRPRQGRLCAEGSRADWGYRLSFHFGPPPPSPFGVSRVAYQTPPASPPRTTNRMRNRRRSLGGPAPSGCRSGLTMMDLRRAGVVPGPRPQTSRGIKPTARVGHVTAGYSCAGNSRRKWATASAGRGGAVRQLQFHPPWVTSSTDY